MSNNGDTNKATLMTNSPVSIIEIPASPPTTKYWKNMKKLVYDLELHCQLFHYVLCLETLVSF